MANTYPEPIPQPFGVNGDRSPIVNTPEANVPNWPLGYPPNFSKPLPDGAQIDRKEWNQLLYILSSNQLWQQQGGMPTFDPKIGKYPKGAMLWLIPPDGIIKKTAESTDVWAGLNLMYHFDTDVVRFPVPVISLIDDNDQDFTQDQGAFAEAWTTLDGWLIEKSSVIPPSTINNVQGNINSVVYAREGVINSGQRMLAEITTSFILAPPDGYLFIKAPIASSGLFLYSIGPTGRTQIEALFPYWLQSYYTGAKYDEVLSAKAAPLSYPPAGASVYPYYIDMPISFTSNSSGQIALSFYGVGVLAAANMSPPKTFKFETKYRIF